MSRQLLARICSRLVVSCLQAEVSLTTDLYDFDNAEEAEASRHAILGNPNNDCDLFSLINFVSFSFCRSSLAVNRRETEDTQGLLLIRFRQKQNTGYKRRGTSNQYWYSVHSITPCHHSSGISLTGEVIIFYIQE